MLIIRHWQKYYIWGKFTNKQIYRIIEKGMERIVVDLYITD